MGRAREYRVVITATAEKMLKAVKKQRGRAAVEQLRELVLTLRTGPELKTEPLTGMLRGFRSLHSGRFRIVVRIVDRTITVYVVGVGWHASGERDDIYQLLQRLVERGSLDPGAPE